LNNDIDQISVLEGQIAAKQSMLENIKSRGEIEKGGRKKVCLFPVCVCYAS
jgi:hypothetical protein